MPSEASSSEEIAKAIVRSVEKRLASTDCETICVIGSSEVMGTCASVLWMISRTAATEAAGSDAVRKTIVAPAGTERVLNQSGTYTIINGGSSNRTVRISATTPTTSAGIGGPQ